MDTANGFSKYRSTLHTSTPPCLPYIGVNLRDIALLNDGNPDYIYGDKINIEKIKLISSVIFELEAYKACPYAITAVKEHQDYIATFGNLNDSEIYNYSLRCEPSNTN